MLIPKSGKECIFYHLIITTYTDACLVRSWKPVQRLQILQKTQKNKDHAYSHLNNVIVHAHNKT